MYHTTWDSVDRKKIGGKNERANRSGKRVST